MSLLQMSVSGAVLISVTAAVRAAAVSRLPKRLFLALWEIAVIRLLIPFSVPSVFSVYSIAGRHIPVFQITAQTPSNGFNPAGMPGLPAAGSVSAVSVWGLVWGAGAALCAGFTVISYLRCRTEYQTALPVHNSFTDQWLKEPLRRRPVQIRQSDKTATPLTYGIIHPVILFPKNTDWNNQTQMQYVLQHEYTHICHYDTARKLIATLVLCIHWFNPMVWVMYNLFNRDIELACDESVIRHFGEGSKKPYALTLIKMEEKKNGITPGCSNFSRNAAEERIRAIMKTKKLTLGLIVLSAVIILCAATLFMTSAKSKIAGSETGSYAAFVKGISNNSITVDLVEYITDVDADRMKELNLTEEDMPDGYYIYNPDETETVWKCNDKTTYHFIDWNGEFTGSDLPESYTTAFLAEFRAYIDTYDQSLPGMPFFFTVENGIVIDVLEKPMA